MAFAASGAQRTLSTLAGDKLISDCNGGLHGWKVSFGRTSASAPGNSPLLPGFPEK